MSERYRNGAFAFGIVVGIGLALNVFVWLDYLAQQQSDSGSSSNNGENYSQVGKFWDWLLRTFVSPSDTLAQWIMAVFTIAATVVLVFTLRSANKTNLAAVEASKAANKANQIMRAEQRPWVTVLWDVPCKFEETEDGKFCKVRLLFDFANKGKTPAFGIHHEWSVFRFKRVSSSIAGREEMLVKALRNMTMPSRTPILFQGEKTDHIFGEGSDRLDIGGDETGDIFLCACLVYALDDKWTELAMEGRVYKLVPSEDLPEGRTHEILRIPGYDRIETWEAEPQP